MAIGRRVLSSFRRSRVVALDVPGTDRSVFARPNTSDVAAFQQVFGGSWGLDLPVEPQLIFDLGANVGYSSVHFALRYPEARIVAVEPEPSNVALLRRNVESLPRVEVVEAAVWPRSGTVALHDPGKGYWGMRVRSGEGTVRAVTVQDLMDRTGVDRVDLVKVDIEGSELELFSEETDWLRGVGTLAIEVHERFRPGSRAAVEGAVGRSGVLFHELPHPEHLVLVQKNS